MKLTVKDINGRGQGELEVKFPLIADGKGTQAVHDAAVAYVENQRMGTACTKTMGEVPEASQKPGGRQGQGGGRGRVLPSPGRAGGGGGVCTDPAASER